MLHLYLQARYPVDHQTLKVFIGAYVNSIFVLVLLTSLVNGHYLSTYEEKVNQFVQGLTVGTAGSFDI